MMVLLVEDNGKTNLRRRRKAPNFIIDYRYDLVTRCVTEHAIKTYLTGIID
jgi:hypothetical protein